MRTVTRHLTLSLVLLAALPLAGCAPEPAPQASQTTAPTDAPVFASDAEALAAATEAYAAYLRTSDEISGAGGVEPERLAPFVSTQLLERELEGFSGFVAANARSVGSTTFLVHKMQSAEYSQPERTNISLYLCEDVTGLDVIDANGDSLVSPTRHPKTPFEVRIGMNDSRQLILEERVVWRGENFC